MGGARAEMSERSMSRGWENHRGRDVTRIIPVLVLRAACGSPKWLSCHFVEQGFESNLPSPHKRKEPYLAIGLFSFIWR